MTDDAEAQKEVPDATELMDVPGSRDRLPTPALVIDREVVRSNLSAMDSLLKGSSLGLRPHVKAHKSLALCRLQLERAGVIGFSAATIGEAEVLAPLNTSVLLTSVLASSENIARAAGLCGRGQDLTLVLDSMTAAQRLNAALEARECTAEVLIDIDAGRHRAGCASVTQAQQVADAIGACGALSVAGLQIYAGHLSHMRDPQRRAQGHAQFVADVARYREALAPVLPGSPVISGGSTGTLAWELAAPVLTELQCGSYPLMDVEYLAQAYSAEIEQWPFEPAVTVQASIISSNWSAHATADAGDKRFASKYGYSPQLVRVPPGITLESASYTPSGDEHGRLEFADAEPPPIGARLECTIPHIDPTMNLFDTAYVVSGDRLVDIWRIDARGR